MSTVDIFTGIEERKETQLHFMIAAPMNTTELFKNLSDTTTELVHLLSSFTNDEINHRTVPGNWTAAQIGEHLSLSLKSIVPILLTTSTTVDRTGDERVKELRDMFLDYSLKFKSAPAIMPAEQFYNKEALIQRLQQSIRECTLAGKEAAERETVSIPGIGEITKYELLYLALYHTMRHIDQIRNLRQ